MQKLKRIPYILSILLLAYMPFHIFLSQWLSTYTGGLDLWKIGKDIVLAGVVLFTICLVYWKGKANKTFGLLVLLTVLYGAMHLVLWATHREIYDRSAMLGIIYNMRLPFYLVLGYGAALLLPKFAFSSVIKVILITSTLVAALGIVQYFLPGDILSHFGYSIERGARAAFYIDDNHDLPPRIMSTLREPNALGAYLILPATALGLLLLREADKNKRTMIIGAFGLHLLAIFLTQSRSAMLGIVLSLGLIVWWQYRNWFVIQIKRFWPILAVLALLVCGSAFSLRNSSFFQDYIIHGNKNEKVADIDSNGYHTLFIKRGLEGIRSEPLGHGPGTAGLASIQNPKGSFLTENYYIQIGYEVGVLGLALFIGLNVWVYILVRRSASPWKFVLLASFWAYVLTNMLLHTWSNEAVAVQWWLLAGLIAGQLQSSQKTQVSPAKDVLGWLRKSG